MYSRKMENRDRRRWQTADENKDGALNKLEFKHFLHPEESDHMRDIVIAETVDDIDKDGDGLISLGEYVGDMFRGMTFHFWLSFDFYQSNQRKFFKFLTVVDWNQVAPIKVTW